MASPRSVFDATLRCAPAPHSRTVTVATTDEPRFGTPSVFVAKCVDFVSVSHFFLNTPVSCLMDC